MGCCEKLRSMSYDKRLRGVQIVLHTIALVTSLGTSLSLGWSVRIFFDNCPLYTELNLEKAANQTIRLRNDVVWAGITRCNYAIYTATCGAILVIMWFWFFLLLRNYKTLDHLGNEVPPDARLLIPWLIISVPLLILGLVVACIISEGHAVFCAGVRKSYSLECGIVGEQQWSYPEDGQYGYQYMHLSLIFSWLWFSALLGTLTVLGIRINHLLQQGATYDAFSIISFRSSYQEMTSSDASSEDYERDVTDDPGFDNPLYDVKHRDVDVGQDLVLADVEEEEEWGSERTRGKKGEKGQSKSKHNQDSQ